MNIKNLSHYGDILAIPFFALLIIYFYNITNKSIIERILLLFSISGFVFDIFFSYLFISRVKISYNYIYIIILCILLFGFVSIKEGNTSTPGPTTQITTQRPTTQEPTTTQGPTTQTTFAPTTTLRPMNPPPPTIQSTNPMILKDEIMFPLNSIKTVNYILNDNVLSYQKKVNVIKQFGVTASTEPTFYNILFNTLYNDEQKVETLKDYIESKYRIRECQNTSTSPPL